MLLLWAAHWSCSCNIFMGFYKLLLFKNTFTNFLYFRCVDAILSNETVCNQFLQKLNSLHSSFVFTYKSKKMLLSMFSNLYKPCFLAVHHCKQHLLMRVGQKNSKTDFLKTTKIERVNGFINTLVILKFFFC